ncbi:MAG: thiamine diphosphokinase [Anaerolineae bacterium]|nr:thiamine diphosphokinase [Promineifilum sp.]MCZ2115757.1 thiamine diphosphokinase [Anaerolineae bacterium]HNS40037.1 thiamine diphosphokinase [Promineifilum sp.]
MEIPADFVLVFANGVIENIAWIEPYLSRAQAVIAADGGIRYPLALGQIPDTLIGDLDSLPEGIDEQLADWDMELIRYPSAKEETDLELALLHARRRFPDAELLVLGGFGGRLDQTLGNITLLAHPELIGHSVTLIDEYETARLITAEATITGRAGDVVSLIPLGGPVRVRETIGLRWPLQDEILDFGPTRGISNEMTGERATVRLSDGMLLCTHATTPP